MAAFVARDRSFLPVSGVAEALFEAGLGEFAGLTTGACCPAASAAGTFSNRFCAMSDVFAMSTIASSHHDFFWNLPVRIIVP